MIACRLMLVEQSGHRRDTRTRLGPYRLTQYQSRRSAIRVDPLLLLICSLHLQTKKPFIKAKPGRETNAVDSRDLILPL
jgi:predicted metalloprotease